MIGEVDREVYCILGHVCCGKATDEPEGEAFDLPIHHVVTLNYGHVLSEVTNLIILE